MTTKIMEKTKKVCMNRNTELSLYNNKIEHVFVI